MDRRNFVKSAALATALSVAAPAFPTTHARPAIPGNLADGLSFDMHPIGSRNIAVWRTGIGPAALFIHGWPLNGLHWRDAMRGLATDRTCISPDLMGLGYSSVPPDTDLSPGAQADMLLDLMSRLGYRSFDIVANDSGTAIAQIMIASSAGRVRSALLTNGDAHTNSPPAALAPAIEAARSGQLVHLIRNHLSDPGFASSDLGLGTLCYSDPNNLSDDLVKAYFLPLLSEPARIAQFQEYGVAFTPNPLLDLRDALRSYTGNVALLWGDSDIHFPMEWAYWLDGLFAGSQGISVVSGGKLFFTEEHPCRVISSARVLWGTS